MKLLCYSAVVCQSSLFTCTCIYIFNGPHLAYIFVVGIIDLIHLFIYLILLHALHPSRVRFISPYSCIQYAGY